MHVCGRSWRGGLWLFTLYVLNSLNFLKHVLLLTKDNVFVLKTMIGSSSQSGQGRLWYRLYGSCGLPVPIAWMCQFYGRTPSQSCSLGRGKAVSPFGDHPLLSCAGELPAPSWPWPLMDIWASCLLMSSLPSSYK